MPFFVLFNASCSELNLVQYLGYALCFFSCCLLLPIIPWPILLFSTFLNHFVFCVSLVYNLGFSFALWSDLKYIYKQISPFTFVNMTNINIWPWCGILFYVSLMWFLSKLLQNEFSLFEKIIGSSDIQQGLYFCSHGYLYNCSSV